MEREQQLETLVVMEFSRDISDDVVQRLVDVINAPEDEGGVELCACRIKDHTYKVNPTSLYIYWNQITKKFGTP